MFSASSSKDCSWKIPDGFDTARDIPRRSWRPTNPNKHLHSRNGVVAVGVQGDTPNALQPTEKTFDSGAHYEGSDSYE